MADAKPVRVGPQMPNIPQGQEGKRNESLRPEEKGITSNGPETDGPVISTVGEGSGAVTVYAPAQYKTSRGLTRQDR